MGIHISVVDKNGSDVPGWDWIRQPHDREFPDLINWEQVTEASGGLSSFRPLNIPELREKIDATDWENKSRYHKLLDFVERGEWIHFSH